MAKIQMIIRMEEWERYRSGEEATAFSLSMNPAGKMTISVNEDELLDMKEEFRTHTQYIVYTIKKAL